MQKWQPPNLENVYSQFGEDSILKAIFEGIPEPQDRVRTCVEFGAWDGVLFSNTANLIINSGWKGIFIESDTKRYRDLVNSYKGLDTTCINALVQFDGEFTLDNILTRANAPTDIDLISIDIDGCDYWILESIDLFLPKVFVVEFNPTIPNSVEYVQPRNLNISQGSSLNAITKLAKRKGYDLVATSLCNAFFVKESFAEIFLSGNRSIDDIHNAVYSNYIWTAFDGTIMLERDLEMFWHDLKINQSKIQVIPLLLRKFPGSYSVPRRFFFKLFSRINKLDKLWSTNV
jgi:hypothetical protein